jgi:hypothetical protein
MRRQMDENVKDYFNIGIGFSVISGGKVNSSKLFPINKYPKLLF